ncbi:hypothetical protein F5883DRAFT_653631 [Diaporthe sp. PMI_573]|nr:hypothetical protein F5883DRAFT_653631 [Diaporthaceae sp. PMI_573]
MSSSVGDAESQTASISDLQGYDTREISSASSATYLGQCEYGPGWLPGSLEWMKRESITYKQSEKGIDSKDLGPSMVPKSTVDLSEDPISKNSGISAQPQQSQPQSPPPSPLSRPEQLARIRRAANKSRAKTKAAILELEATEKAESLKHKALSETVRGLQEEVFALKSELLLHGNCNDHTTQAYLEQRARKVAIGSRATTDLESDTSSLVATRDPLSHPGIYSATSE